MEINYKDFVFIAENKERKSFAKSSSHFFLGN